MANPPPSTTSAPDRTVDEIFGELFGGVTQDPFPLYEELREQGDGIHLLELVSGYTVTRYSDVRLIGTDPATFSSDTFDLSAGIHDPSDAEHLRFIEVSSQIFMFSDPPKHTRIRSALRHSFSPDVVERWRPVVERVTDELLARYTPGDEIDIMPGLAADVPVAVIAAILGVPQEKWPMFREWSFAYASTLDPLVQGDRRDAAIRTSLEMFDYLHELIQQRRAQTEDDLISHLTQTDTLRGDRLHDSELIAQIALLLIAGNETTTNLIGNGLSLLFEHPEAKSAIMADPSRLPAAIEEMLRLDPPLHFTGRKVTKDVTLGDHELAAGTNVLVCISSANRDPRAFANSSTFDINRSNNKHLAFFHGIHFCIGAPLARLEGNVIFEKLLCAYPDIGPGSEPAVRRTLNAISRGWEKRPVRL